MSCLKILDFVQLFFAYIHIEKKIQKLVIPLSKHVKDTQYKNHLDFFALIKRIFLQTLVEYFF